MIKLTRTKELDKFYQRMQELQTSKKANFTLDYDNYSDRRLIILYAKLFAFFLNNESEYKHELDKNWFIRPTKSSSKKKSYHIKVYIENTFFENIYFRAKFGDDRRRLTTDIKRFNMAVGSRENNLPVYDVAFKEKIIDGKKFVKDFEIINILDLVCMRRKTFYKLIKYIKIDKRKNIDLILNSIKTFKKEKSEKVQQIDTKNVFQGIVLDNDESQY